MVKSLPGNIEMSFAEIDTLRELRHPNIVQYLALFQRRSGAPWMIVMQLCAEGDLLSLVGRYGAPRAPCLSWRRRVALAADVSYGMHYLHSYHQTAHLDMKSSNVLLYHGRAKVADFAYKAVNNKDTLDIKQ